MKHVLVVSGHTDLNDSVANKTILEEVARFLPEAEIDYLDREYPDFKINVPAEQEKLVRADIVVFQFPLFWYSMPSILERWMEKTFVHGFSHGTAGDKLHGKTLLLSVTTGAPESAYQKGNGYTMDELFPAIHGTCRLTGLNYGGAVYTFGVSYQLRNTPEGLAEIKAKAKDHAARLVKLIEDVKGND